MSASRTVYFASCYMPCANTIVHLRCSFNAKQSHIFYLVVYVQQAELRYLLSPLKEECIEVAKQKEQI